MSFLVLTIASTSAETQRLNHWPQAPRHYTVPRSPGRRLTQVTLNTQEGSNAARVKGAALLCPSLGHPTCAFPAATPASWMQPSVPWPPEVALTPVESFWSKATVASTIILPSLNSNKFNTFFFKRVCILGVMKNFSVCEALLKLRVKWCFLLSSTGIPWRYTPLVPESWNKASHTDFSDFPVHVKVIFTLCWSLLGVQ